MTLLRNANLLEDEGREQKITAAKSRLPLPSLSMCTTTSWPNLAKGTESAIAENFLRFVPTSTPLVCISTRPNSPHSSAANLEERTWNQVKRLIASKQMLEQFVVLVVVLWLSNKTANVCAWKSHYHQTVYWRHLAFQRELTWNENVLDPSKSFMSPGGGSLEFLSRQHMLSSRT